MGSLRCTVSKKDREQISKRGQNRQMSKVTVLRNGKKSVTLGCDAPFLVMGLGGPTRGPVRLFVIWDPVKNRDLWVIADQLHGPVGNKY